MKNQLGRMLISIIGIEMLSIFLSKIEGGTLPTTFVKHRSTYYTEQKVRNVADNIRRYAWAKKEKDDIVLRADSWLADYGGDYSRLWDIIPSQSIPRSFAVNSINGCLVCGTNINKYGNYSYLYDKHKVDWKLKCPNCHLSFPTNDFRAYYEGGLESNGKFNPEKARRFNDKLLREGKRENLINLYFINGLTSEQIKDLKAAGASDSTIHRIVSDPEWGVDNSMGYQYNPSDNEKYGNPYTFVAYYAHWALWYWRIMPMLEDLSRAYMFTRYSNDPQERQKSRKYGDATVVMLDRIADLYPEMRLSFPRNGYYGFPNCGYPWYTHPVTGRVIGSVWENTFIKSIMLSYDAVYPYIDSLSRIAKDVLIQKSGEREKGNPNTIKIHFENGILREVAKAYYDCDLNGNPGMEQSTLALASVIIDHNPETLEWLNVVFAREKPYWEAHRREGGGALLYLINKLSRDGQGDEVSIGYNAGWLANWLIVAKVLDGYQIPEGKKLKGGINSNLYDNPRFEQMFMANVNLLMIDHFVPHIGDTSHTGNPSFVGNPEYFIIDPNNLILGYEKYKTTELAQAVYQMLKGKIGNVHNDIFTKDPERIQEDIKNAIRKDGELNLTSHNYTAYGLGILRDGLSKLSEGYSTKRALDMFYGAKNGTHHHADPLGLGYYAYRLDLMPDFGYPNTMKGWNDDNEEMKWDKSTTAHNAVSFDGFGYNAHFLGYGKPLHFDDTPEVKLIHVSSNDVNLKGKVCAREYDRTTAMIRIDDKSSYVIDLFHVNSNIPYTYNFHTAEVDSTATRYENVNIITPVTQSYSQNTLRNIKSLSSETGRFSIDWNIVDTWNCLGKGKRSHTDIHFKVTALGNHQSIHLGEAVPPTNYCDNPKWLPMLMLSNKGDTMFSMVFEAYKGKSKIFSVDSVSVSSEGKAIDPNKVRAIKVKLINGRTDYIVCSHTTHKLYRIDNKFNFNGYFGVYSEKGGKCIFKYINDGTSIAGINVLNRIVGVVTDATNELSNNNSITIKLKNSIDTKLLKGRYIYISNDDIIENYLQPRYNAVYPIISVKDLHNNSYLLSLGKCSVIRAVKDLDDYGQGLLRDFNLGSTFYIPLSLSNGRFK
jgi:hypothetical protein